MATFLSKSPAIAAARALPLLSTEVEPVRIPLMMAAFLMAGSMALNGGENLRLAVSPAVSMAPTNLFIRARIERNTDNRLLQIIAESGDFYRSSEMQLDGDHAPAIATFEFRGVPGGDYVVHGILTDAAGHRRAIAEQHVTVIAPLGH